MQDLATFFTGNKADLLMAVFIALLLGQGMEAWAQFIADRADRKAGTLKWPQKLNAWSKVVKTATLFGIVITLASTLYP